VKQIGREGEMPRDERDERYEKRAKRRDAETRHVHMCWCESILCRLETCIQTCNMQISTCIGVRSSLAGLFFLGLVGMGPNCPQQRNPTAHTYIIYIDILIRPAEAG
jgi:hypothetical protein